MKRIVPFLFLSLLSLAVQAQRYVSEVFTNVSVTENQLYSVNATVLAVSQVMQAIPQPLYADIYEPVGDTATERPLVILMHTGNFIPPTFNGGCGGTRKDAQNIEFAERLARMGYVVASIDYRLGWDPTNQNQTIRVYTLINAAYRGVQDSRTAVRFFKKTVAEGGNPYGIDPDKIVLWGFGTGGYIAYASATLDTITDTWIPKFVTPQGPMVNQSINGDVNGTTVGVTPFAIPPFPAGDTLNYPNHIGYSSEFQMAVSLGGALGDTSWIDPSDPPILGVHVTTDPFAPCGIGDVVVPPPLNLVVVEVMGACAALPIAAAEGLNDAFDVTFIDPVSQHVDDVSNGVAGFYPLYSTDPTEGSPWSFASSTNPYNVPGANCDTAYTQSAPFIDSILNFFAPRACLALNLGCDLTDFSATGEVPAAEVQLQISPNPATDDVRFSSAVEFPMEAVYVYDMNGRLVKAHVDIEGNQFTMPRNGLQPGVYIAKVMFKHGFAAQRILYR